MKGEYSYSDDGGCCYEDSGDGVERGGVKIVMVMLGVGGIGTVVVMVLIVRWFQDIEMVVGQVGGEGDGSDGGGESTQQVHSQVSQVICKKSHGVGDGDEGG